MTSTEGKTIQLCLQGRSSDRAIQTAEAQLVELPAGKVLWTPADRGALALLAEVDRSISATPFLRTRTFYRR